MNLITIWEGDGTKTRVVVGGSPMAIAVAEFFRAVTKLNATLENVETLDVLPADEIKRGHAHMKEWREHGKELKAVK